MQNIFDALIAQTDWALLLLRLVLALIFIAHGWRKLRNFNSTLQWIGNEGFKPGWFWGVLVIAAEFLGGIAILIGLAVQLVAIILTMNMMVAFIWNLRRGNGFFQHLELDLILIASLLLLATLGNGFFALGNVL